MIITYDAEEDILYIRLRDVPLGKSVDYEPGVTVDLDEQGDPIGLEILDASKRMIDGQELLSFHEREVVIEATS